MYLFLRKINSITSILYYSITLMTNKAKFLGNYCHCVTNIMILCHLDQLCRISLYYKTTKHTNAYKLQFIYHLQRKTMQLTSPTASSATKCFKFNLYWAVHNVSNLTHVIIDCSSINQLDYTGGKIFLQAIKELNDCQYKVYLCNLRCK